MPELVKLINFLSHNGELLAAGGGIALVATGLGRWAILKIRGYGAGDEEILTDVTTLVSKPEDNNS